MAEVLANVKPTRMELLKLRRRVKLADRGHKLLKEKRDALVSEFMVVIRQYREARNFAEESLRTAFHNLLMATKNGAELLRLDDQIGTLKIGKLADLIVVDGNPLQDITILQDLQRIHWVLKEGQSVKTPPDSKTS